MGGEICKRYQKWCKRADYNFNKEKAWDVFVAACGHCRVLPKDTTTKLLVQQAIRQITTISESLAVIAREMKLIAEQLPEYPIVMSFYGVGGILGPQLIAEIGDVYRFPKKGSLEGLLRASFRSNGSSFRLIVTIHLSS